MQFDSLSEHELAILLKYAALTGHAHPNLLIEASRRLSKERDAEYLEMLKRNEYVLAVRKIRNDMGYSIVEAKEYIDKIKKRYDFR